MLRWKATTLIAISLYSFCKCWQDWQCLINCRWERFNLQGKLLINLTEVLGIADDLKCRKQILILMKVINHWARPEEKWTWSKKDCYEGSEFTLSARRIMARSVSAASLHPTLFTSRTSGEDWRVYCAIIQLLRDDTILGVGPWETLISLLYLPKHH